MGRMKELDMIEPRPEPIENDEHECDDAGEPDIQICRDCKDHASFCSDCGLSGCCGANPYELD
jgi:hypothetical protein